MGRETRKEKLQQVGLYGLMEGEMEQEVDDKQGKFGEQKVG